MLYEGCKYYIPNRFGEMTEPEIRAEEYYILELLKQGCTVELHPHNSRYGLPDEGRWPFCRSMRNPE